MNGTQDPNVNPGPAAPQPAASVPPTTWQPPQSQQQQLFDARKKSPGIAAILSICPGLGQVYVGYYTRGFAHVIVAATIMTILGSGGARHFEPLFVFFLVFFWMYNMIDAGRRAALYNHAMDGMASVELPEDFKMPQMAGSILGGAILIVASVIALSYSAFGMSLEWVQHWWPLAPLAVGLYLVVAGARDRANRSGPPASQRD